MKITLLGDSIRGQYLPLVKERLGEAFEIFSPVENCRFAQYTLRGLFEWEPYMRGSRIVHFNCGLWDVCDLFDDGYLFTPEEEYLRCMLRIADILLKAYDRVIFATTTPVRLENRYDSNEDIARYNERLVPLLRARGVQINDLHAALAGKEEQYIANDYIHLNEEGMELCADMVAAAVRQAACELDAVDDVKAVASTEDVGAPVLLEGEA